MSINWKLWTRPPAQVALWEGVALMLDLNPRDLEPGAHQFMKAEPVFRRDSFPDDTKRAEFADALFYATRATTNTGPIIVPPGCPTNSGWTRVSLADVVKFFVSVGNSNIPSPLLEWLSEPASTGLAGSEPFEAQGLAQPRPEAPDPEEVKPSLSTDELCEAFDCVGLTSIAWRIAMTKNRPNWLMACRASVGKPGLSPVQARWDPLQVAKALIRGSGRKAGVVPTARLDAAFKRPGLRPFSAEWAQLRLDNPSWGD